LVRPFIFFGFYWQFIAFHAGGHKFEKSLKPFLKEEENALLSNL
jgi:hypothetical protein